jgi:hypothetical protein
MTGYQLNHLFLKGSSPSHVVLRRFAPDDDNNTANAAGEPIRSSSFQGDGDSFNDDKERADQAICRSTFSAIQRKLERVGLPVGDGMDGRATVLAAYSPTH